MAAARDSRSPDWSPLDINTTTGWLVGRLTCCLAVLLGHIIMIIITTTAVVIMMIRHRITCNCSKQHGSCMCVSLPLTAEEKISKSCTLLLCLYGWYVPYCLTRGLWSIWRVETVSC